MLKLSCADYTFPLLDRRQALALIRLLKFDFVDIGLFERSTAFRTSDLCNSPRRFMDGVRDDLGAACLHPADVFLQVGLEPGESSANDPDPKIRATARETFLHTLELCASIGCDHLTGLPGVVHGDSTRDLALAAEEAAWRVERAQATAITYAIEPHLGSICATTSSTHELLAMVTGLTLTLDYGHFIYPGETNEAIHSLLSHASHLHLRGAAPGRLQTPAAESTIDPRHIVRTLSTDYTGKAALEYVWAGWHDCNRTDNLSETILLRQQITEIAAAMALGESHHV